MKKRAFAVAAHPDDIEFLMAGTLILLGQAGYELHYMTVANGSCGTAQLARDEIVRIRREESQRAAASIGAVFHESLVDDLAVFYEKETLARLAAVMRQVVEQEPALAASGLTLHRCPGLAEAVQRANQVARAGDVVLLSPGGTSFDAYGNFEERGQHFRTLVNGLSQG